MWDKFICTKYTFRKRALLIFNPVSGIISLMKIVLLAGGVSKRLWPLTIDKNLWPFYPDCLLTNNLKSLAQVGVNEVVVVTNPNSLEEAKKLTKDLDLKLTFVVQMDALGMGQALLAAEKEIENSEILVLNCDDIVEESLLEQVIKEATTGQHDLILVGKKLTDYIDGGYFEMEGNRAIGVVEKPGKGNEPSDLGKLVVDYFKDSNFLLEKLKTITSENDDLYEWAVDQLLKEKDSLVIPYEGFWQTVKYPWQLLDLLSFMLSKITESKISEVASISPRAVIEGPVIIEKGVKIFENAKVRGPAYIGENVVIANNALVRESYIGKGSVVGFASEVARSYLGKDCWTHNNFVGDSLLQENVSFGVGTVLTNLKLDEGEIHSIIKGNKIPTGKVKLGAIIGSNVRIGSNSTIMPGVKIGSNSFIGASVSVLEDLEEKQFLYAVQEQVKKANKRVDQIPSRGHFKGKI